jgi:CDP-glycerol glycerophosphotransferase
LKSPAAIARRQARRLTRAVQFSFHARYRNQPLRTRTIVYESFSGNGALCNPEALFRALLADPEFADWTHIWVLDHPRSHKDFLREFGHDDRVKIVAYRSAAYFEALATSEYLVNNATFPPEFSKRAGQTYLNTWHGTPLKHMGFDMPQGGLASANTLRNFLMSDYLLAQNEFMADTMYEAAYRLDNVFTGRIVTEGYPRVDRQRLSEPEVAATRRRLEDAGLAVGDREIVLYAPTWHGDSFTRPDDDIDDLVASVAALQAELGDERVVLLKTHQVVHKLAAHRDELTRVLVPNAIPTNVMLGVAAGLITDYSSIFFDYLATGRPIVFYTPDDGHYEQTRGTYFAPDELPGPVETDARAVGRTLRGLLTGDIPPLDRYAAWQQRFTPYDDGAVAQRIVDLVFRGRREGARMRGTARDGRTRIMMFIGGMRSNGITSSAMNLLGGIDHDRYDVTVMMSYSVRRWHVANQALIHPRVRQIFRTGGMNGSKAVQLRRRLNERRGLIHLHADPDVDKRLWDDEWTRVFGDAEFDWCADFSGYGPFWAMLLLHSPDMPRAIWLHNEMASDRRREVNGKMRMYRSLGNVFALYDSFDRLVSVSPRLTELNRKELAEFAPADKFATVRNLPNVQRVLAGIPQPLRELESHPKDPEDPETLVVPAWADELDRHHADPEGTGPWFVNVGRLSPEKNQERLIRAFAGVHERRPDARLVIVGTGPLRGHLTGLVEELELSDCVVLTGAYSNPFAIMARCDCFVLSSRYEGQPMVLLEAAVCNLPIVSTAFASVHDALPNDTIHVVGQKDEALRDGMLAFLDGEVPASHLDIEAYTAEVVAEFDAVVADTVRASRST